MTHHESMDHFFESVEKNVTAAISRFAAFLFFLFAAGIAYGLFFQNDPFLLLLPLALGAIALYSRNITILVFLLVALFVLGGI